jgi:DNA helicase-2/ATP-dependent DNA helicase PcrA
MNFKVAKGATFARVLIAPSSPITGFIRSGSGMESLTASSFYVPVTRAEQSVAIVLDDPGDSELPYWTPSVSTRHRP